MNFCGFELSKPTEAEFLDALGFTEKDMYKALDDFHSRIPPGDSRWDVVSRAVDILHIGFLRKQISENGFRL